MMIKVRPITTADETVVCAPRDRERWTVPRTVCSAVHGAIKATCEPNTRTANAKAIVEATTALPTSKKSDSGSVLVNRCLSRAVFREADVWLRYWVEPTAWEGPGGPSRRNGIRAPISRRVGHRLPGESRLVSVVGEDRLTLVEIL